MTVLLVKVLAIARFLEPPANRTPAVKPLAFERCTVLPLELPLNSKPTRQPVGCDWHLRALRYGLGWSALTSSESIT